jgi:PAS domain S-box-containing protein
MVIEGDHKIAESLRRRLEQAGYAVTALVASGEEALRHGAEHRPDIVLTNVTLEGELTGIDTAVLLQERLALPVIYLTASTDPVMLRRALETAPYGYLLHPCDIRQIVTTIETARARHAHEQRTQAQAHLLTMTLYSIGDALLTTDAEGRVTMLNPAAEHLTGWCHDEALGQPIATVFQVIQPASQAPVENPALQALRERRSIRTSLGALLVARTGRTLPLASCAAPIGTAQESPLGAVIIGRDMTEQRRLEAHQLQVQTMQTVDTLTAGIAHHFNNMLNGILGFTELALEGMLPQSPVWSYLQQVLTAGRRASDLVYQMLVFSRQQRMERYPINPAMFLHDAITTLRTSLQDNVTIREDLDLEAGMILGDASQLHEVFKHLCNNALYAMRETGGVLHIRLSRVDVDTTFALLHPALQPGSYVQLTVSDTGQGMSHEVQTHIFEPFFTTKGVGEGAGMGLAVVHGIVTHHGGAVLVESTPGKGTTMSVYLPRLTETTVQRPS